MASVPCLSSLGWQRVLPQRSSSSICWWRSSFVHHAAFFSDGHVELVAIYIIVFATLVFTGPGRFSVDNHFKVRQAAHTTRGAFSNETRGRVADLKLATLAQSAWCIQPAAADPAFARRGSQPDMRCGPRPSFPGPLLRHPEPTPDLTGLGTALPPPQPTPEPPVVGSRAAFL